MVDFKYNQINNIYNKYCKYIYKGSLVSYNVYNEGDLYLT